MIGFVGGDAVVVSDVYMYVWEYIQARCQYHWVSYSVTPSLILRDKVSHWTWNTTNELAWLASKPNYPPVFVSPELV